MDHDMIVEEGDNMTTGGQSSKLIRRESRRQSQTQGGTPSAANNVYNDAQSTVTGGFGEGPALLESMDWSQKIFYAASAGSNDLVKSDSMGLKIIRRYFEKEVAKGTEKQKADSVDPDDPQKNTLLMTACIHGNRAITEYLLDLGADQNRKNNSGETALYLAADNGKVICLRSLMMHATKVYLEEKREEEKVQSQKRGMTESQKKLFDQQKKEEKQIIKREQKRLTKEAAKLKSQAVRALQLAEKAEEKKRVEELERIEREKKQDLLAQEKSEEDGDAPPIKSPEKEVKRAADYFEEKKPSPFTAASPKNEVQKASTDKKLIVHAEEKKGDSSATTNTATTAPLAAGTTVPDDDTKQGEEFDPVDILDDEVSPELEEEFDEDDEALSMSSNDFDSDEDEDEERLHDDNLDDLDLTYHQDRHVTHFKNTPIFAAASKDRFACLELFAKAYKIGKTEGGKERRIYPDFNQANRLNETPLIVAAKNGHVTAVNFLVNLLKGKNKEIPSVQIDAKDIYGWSARALAEEFGHRDKLPLFPDYYASTKADDHGANKSHDESHEEIDYAATDSIVNILVNAGAKDTGPPIYSMDPFFMGETNEVVLDEKDIQAQKESLVQDEMKIQTMYRMVEDCTILTQGKDVVRKVLYLTNKQASLFDEHAMERAVQALDIGSPKFVIYMLGSLGMGTQMRRSHTENAEHPDFLFGRSPNVGSELCIEDERAVEMQILLFMRNCILPLAMQTSALIMISGSDDCYLSTALSKVVVSEQARLGDDCPFTVIATTNAPKVHYRAISNDPIHKKSIASQIARQHTAWQKNIVRMNEKYSKIYLRTMGTGRSDLLLEQCDLTEAGERYIVFESYDEPISRGDLGAINTGPQRNFESVFLQYMTRKLPSIAIQSLIPSNGFPFLVDLTSRNIPVLLLDCTERAFTTLRENPTTEPITQLAKRASVDDPEKGYHAFPLVYKSDIEDIVVMDGRVVLEGRQALWEIAKAMLEDKCKILSDAGIVDMLSTSHFAFFHKVLTFGSDLAQEGQQATEEKPTTLYMRLIERENMEKMNKDSAIASIPPELVHKVLYFYHTTTKKYELVAALNRVTNWISEVPKQYNFLKGQALNLQKSLKKKFDDIQANNGKFQDNDFETGDWLSQYNLLTSTGVFSGSVFDLDECKRILGSVAKIDRLPASNSLEALRILQDAWDHVEVYHAASVAYKRASKLSYYATLLISVGITFLSLIMSIRGDDFKLHIIVLSFIGTAVGAYISFSNPAVKWQSLRMAALSMESNIWTFRTRAGPYRTKGEGYDTTAERTLSEALEDIKEKILEGADIKMTSFFSRTQSLNTHHQHGEHNKPFGAIDNFLIAPTGPNIIEGEVEERHNEWDIDSENDEEEWKREQAQKPFPVRMFNSLFGFDKFHRKRHGLEYNGKYLSEGEASKRRLQEKAKDVGLISTCFRCICCFCTSSSPIVVGGSDTDDDKRSNKQNRIDEEEIDEITGKQQHSKGLLGGLTETLHQLEEGITQGLHSYSRTRKHSHQKYLTDCLKKLRSEDDYRRVNSKDTHYEPLQPDAYIRFRIIPAIIFYKSRIPGKNRVRYISQSLLVLGSIASAGFGFFDLAQWSGGIAIVTAAITAYLEFSGTNSKIGRYSFTVHRLQELVYWWQTLRQIDRSAVPNIDRLVLTAEELLQKEQHAWKSTSQAVKMLKKASESEGDGKGDKKEN